MRRKEMFLQETRKFCPFHFMCVDSEKNMRRDSDGFLFAVPHKKNTILGSEPKSHRSSFMISMSRRPNSQELLSSLLSLMHQSEGEAANSGTGSPMFLNDESILFISISPGHEKIILVAGLSCHTTLSTRPPPCFVCLCLMQVAEKHERERCVCCCLRFRRLRPVSSSSPIFLLTQITSLFCCNRTRKVMMIQTDSRVS